MISKQLATLVAAGIAAATALINLVVTISANKRAEFREAFRNSLDDHIHDIADALHQTTSSTIKLCDAEKEEIIDDARGNMMDAQEKLSKLRPKIRYSLYGINYGIKIISRFPKWVDQSHDASDSCENMVNHVNKLSDALHRAIRRAYLRGRPPSIFDCALVRYRAWRLKSARNKSMDESSEEDC
jgi:hypothetical protein